MGQVQCVRCCKINKHYELTKNWICANMVDVAIMTGMPGEFRQIQTDRPYHFCSAECAGLWLYGKIRQRLLRDKPRENYAPPWTVDKIIRVEKPHDNIVRKKRKLTK